MKEVSDPNPYLEARQTWNSQVDKAFNEARTSRIISVACLMLALASVAGWIAVASQTKFIPYVVEVDHWARP